MRVIRHSVAVIDAVLVILMVMLGAIAMVLFLVGCSASPGASDPYLHSEEPALADFCAKNPHRGTCP